MGKAHRTLETEHLIRESWFWSTDCPVSEKQLERGRKNRNTIQHGKSLSHGTWHLWQGPRPLQYCYQRSLAVRQKQWSNPTVIPIPSPSAPCSPHLPWETGILGYLFMFHMSSVTFWSGPPFSVNYTKTPDSSHSYYKHLTLMLQVMQGESESLRTSTVLNKRVSRSKLCIHGLSNWRNQDTFFEVDGSCHSFNWDVIIGRVSYPSLSQWE